MNFLGLGFSFGAKNNGLLQMQKNAAKGFGQMANAQVQNNQQLQRGSSMLERFNTVLQLLSLNQLRKIADGVQNAATAGQNLTTGYEAEVLQNKKTTAMMAYQWGKSSASIQASAQEMANATGLSFEKTAQAVIEFGNESEKFKQIGIMNATQLGKAMEASGLDASELRSNLQTLTGVVGIKTTAGVQALIGSFIEAGQQTGDVRSAMTQFESTLGRLQKVAAAAGKQLPEDQLVSLGKQTAQVTAGMFQMGWGMKDASRFSEMLSEKLVDSKIEFQDMFAGTQQDIPALASALAIGTGDVQKAFKLMEQGPAGFMQGLADMAAKAKENGGDTTAFMKFMGAQMRQVFGNDEAMISLFMQKATKATTKAMEDVASSTKTLGQAAASYVDARSLDEKLKLSRDVFVANFRKINNVGGDFVAQQQKAFKSFGKQLSELAKDKGPMGDIVKKMAELHQLGAQAVIPEVLRPMVTLFGTIADEMAPAIAAVAGLAFIFGPVAIPIAAAVAAVGAMVMWFAEAKVQGKSTGEALKHVGDKLKKSWEWLKKFGKIVWDAVVSTLKDIWKELSSIDWKGMWNTFVKEAGPVLQGLFKNVMSWLFQAIDWLLNTGLPWAIEVAWEALKGIVALAMDAIMGIVDGIGDYLKKAFPEYADTIQAVFDIIHDTLDGIKGAFAWIFEILPKLGNAVASFLLHPIESIQKAFGAVVDGVGKVWNMVFGGDPSAPTKIAANVAKATGTANPAALAISTPTVATNNPTAKVKPQSAPSPAAAKKAMGSKAETDQSLLSATNMPSWYADWKASFQKALADQAQMIADAIRGRGAPRVVPAGGSRDEMGTGQMLGTASNGRPR